MVSSLFGTNGVRRTWKTLKPDLALRIARGCANYLGKNIGVARDERLTGECLEYAVRAGICSAGSDAVVMGKMPTPTAEFAVKKLRLDGCIIITASHNPPEWNALKVVDGRGVSVSKERGIEIEKLMDKRASWDLVGKERKIGFSGEYCLSASKFVGEIKGINALFDFGNGAVCEVKEAFSKVKQWEGMNDNPDGRFPNRNSEPTKENICELIKSMKSGEYDVGVAWDGDGDRVVLVDENGEYIIGDRVFAISALIELEHNKGDIVTTVATSRVIEDVAERYGVECHYTKIGSPYLSEKMASGKYAIGGEEVGGVIWPKFSLAKDGIITALKIMKTLSDGEKISSLNGSLPSYFNVKGKLSVKDKESVFEKAKNVALKEFESAMCIDGVRVDLDSGWFIIRPSGTEDYIRVFSEAKTEKEAISLFEKAKNIVMEAEDK